MGGSGVDGMEAPVEWHRLPGRQGLSDARGALCMQISTIGLDLVKRLFQVQSVDVEG
jgi:hypothetical protein